MKDRLTILQGDCLEVMRTLPEESVHCCVTDPPYHLTAGKKGGTGFMGKAWDGGDVAFRPETWAAVMRVVKPGGYLLAFGGTRTFHRLACAIEDAGWELRDTIMWVYGSGFPKSLDVSKAIDKAAGEERELVGEGQYSSRKPRTYEGGNSLNISQHDSRVGNPITAPATEAAKQWEGWGTALKPAWEPIIVARKPLIGTVAENVQAHGTGAMNIDGCRVPAEKVVGWTGGGSSLYEGGLSREGGQPHPVESGRWPANLIHDGSEEVVAAFPDAAGQLGDLTGHNTARESPNGCFNKFGPAHDRLARGDSGSAARFFYTAKASKEDRGSFNKHPTVKPGSLMAYLVRLVCPPGGTVLDPFSGSGSTGRAAIENGFKAVLIDLDQSNCETANLRCDVTPGLPFP